MSLVLDEHGTFLGKSGRSLYVKTPSGKKTRRSTYNLQEVISLCNCSVSSQAIELLSQNGIPFVMIRRGRPFAIVHPFFNHGTVHTRREQLSAYWDTRGGELARAFVLGAMRNKANLLLYWSRNRRNTSPKLAANLEEKSNAIIDMEPLLEEIIGSPDEVRLDLMHVEGQAARQYFEGLELIIPEEFRFDGRTRRPPTDPVNAMLSYGYAILYSRVFTTTAACGLEPFAGYLHSDRSGKPSLILDVVEEFRQVSVDRTVMRLLSQRQVNPEGFILQEGKIMMNKDTKRLLLANLLESFDVELRVSSGRKRSLSQVMMSQCRSLVRFLIGKDKEYKPYIFRW
ncbi:MAG: putative CRISPR-associated endonuclease Cas1 1 [Candidatus Thorarchaeota archaeon]|nr:MAG: putative CRISPR-associated endonuclease Cas1 1 [Candidatus Thorarchaeota archaeon]